MKTSTPSTTQESVIRLVYILVLLLGIISPLSCQAWITQSKLSSSSRKHQSILRESSLQRLQPLSSSLSAATTADNFVSTDDDDEEYEYVEYDMLTEPEFMGSEWLVGTVMDSNQRKIQETWVRLATNKDGKNVAIWGDNSQGTWNFDTANQFLSFSKERFWGKEIWAGVVDDYYFTNGTVRGWNFFSAAAVLGQWQAKRLGVDPEEAGTPPWFEEEEEEGEELVEEQPVNNKSEEVSESSTSTDESSGRA
jgi:hypothetical protein